jgi:phosphoribosylanthranilate isomerase
MSLFVKICGITRVTDALRAAELGISAIGLNFWPSSKRHVTLETAAEIARALSPGVLKVGVFVNASAEAVHRAEQACGLDLVQFHGDESPAFCAQWGDRAIRAIRLHSPADLDQLAQYRSVRMILVDAAVEGAYGGTGVTANWQLARQACETGAQILLAGGLTPGNVAEAVRAVGPAGVDVAGGVESTPGIKDADKMRAFVAAARG